VQPSPHAMVICDFQREPMCIQTTSAEYMFAFEEPSVSVQYQASITDASGQVIAPGGSVSCGTKITLQCLPHKDQDISWFSQGGSYDSPYGTWNTTGSSCDDKYYVVSDVRGQRRGDIYANLSLPYPPMTRIVHKR
jgi:hypothetical protein